MQIYLVRHPKPNVAAGLCYGGTDVGVAAAEQARVLAALAVSLPRHIGVFCSPAVRCAGLAAQLAEALASAAPVVDPRLAEMHFGDWEMRAWSEIARSEIDAWTADLAGYRPGGGETVLEVARRISAFQHDLLASGRDSAAVICHAGAMRLLTAFRADMPLRELALLAAATPHRIAYGEVVRIER